MDITYKLVLAMVLSACVTYGLTPLVRRLAIRVGAVDIPKDERRVHTKPIPRMGGLAIFIGFLVAYALFSEMEFIKMAAIIFGASLMVITGIIDDIHTISAKTKLLFQLLAAIVLYACGIRIEFFSNFIHPDQGMIPLGIVSFPVTVFWIVGITNTVNLIDGLDGLAAGISSIGAITLTLVALQFGGQDIALAAHMNEVALLTIIIAGACIGFLPHNFNPARIFMGDAGSLMLGFLLASASVDGALKGTAVVAVAIPVLALGLPIFDTTFAILRRLMSGRSIAEADKGHLHHRLLQVGMNQKRAVLTLYLIAALMGTSAIFLASQNFFNTFVVLTLALILIAIPIHQTMSSDKVDDEA